MLSELTREDGWASFFKGYGVRGRDTSESDIVTPPVELSARDFEFMYRGDAIAARAIDVLPDDAMRQGWITRIPTTAPAAAAKKKAAQKGKPKPGQKTDKEDPPEPKAKKGERSPEEVAEISDDLDAYHRRLKTTKKLRTGFGWGRIYGGAIMVIGADDGGTGLDHFKTPLDLAKIKSVNWLHVLEREQVTPGPLETDPRKPEFGEPRSYMVGNFGGATMVEIHASRVIRFHGVPRPRSLTAVGTADVSVAGDEWWDDSVLTRLYDPLRNYQVAMKGCALTLRDFNRGVYKIKNLAQHMGANKEELVRRRIEIAELSLGILNALLLDADKEGFEFMQRPVAGLHELLDRQGIHVAASTGMPITLLLGLSPGGLGTGEDEDKRWNNVVQAYQQDEVGPALERLTQVIFAAKDGPTQGKIPEKWTIEFVPLRSPSEKETAEIRKLVAEAMGALVREGILLPEEVAQSLFGKGEFRMDVELDHELRAEAKKAEEELAKQMAEQMGSADPALDDELANTRQPGKPGKPGKPGAKPPVDEERQQRLRDSIASGVVRICDAVNEERLGVGQATALLTRLYGFPHDEAEALVAA
jgi:phage-related protein (TIGR01555 family)